MADITIYVSKLLFEALSKERILLPFRLYCLRERCSLLHPQRLQCRQRPQIIKKFLCIGWVVQETTSTYKSTSAGARVGRESRMSLRRWLILIVACRRGAGSASPVSHAMVDSDAPVALPSTLIAGVASRTSAFLFGLYCFYPCELLVKAWSKICVPVLRCCITYISSYIYTS